MSEGQARLYHNGTQKRLRKITVVGAEQDPNTTHLVECGGDELEINKVAGATVEVGDYVITVDKVGHPTPTTPLTHLTAAVFASDFYRYANIG